MKLPVPETETKKRIVWRYGKADWDALRTKLDSVDWTELQHCSVDDAAQLWTQQILQAAQECIPKKELCEKKSTHPWVNDRVLEMVRQKEAAAGTEHARSACEACSACLKEEFEKYIEKEREQLKKEPRASKGWWSKTRRLLNLRGRTCGIPALKKYGGAWCTDAKSKADHLADLFTSKYKLAAKLTNDYSKLEEPYYRHQGKLRKPTLQDAEEVLMGLRIDRTRPFTDKNIEGMRAAARSVILPAGAAYLGRCKMARVVDAPLDHPATQEIQRLRWEQLQGDPSYSTSFKGDGKAFAKIIYAIS